MDKIRTENKNKNKRNAPLIEILLSYEVQSLCFWNLSTIKALFNQNTLLGLIWSWDIKQNPPLA